MAAIPGSTDTVILVDEHDQPIGSENKLKAHQHGGKLHRAFSIFVFNGRGDLLLQRRAASKYHFGGLWTNTCCSHPRSDYPLIDYARARLQEEMGFDTPLEDAFNFIYRASDEHSGLTEHEFDHVLFGRFEDDPRPNPEEVDAWKWIAPAALRADINAHPEHYTPWFKIVLARALAHRRA